MGLEFSIHALDVINAPHKTLHNLQARSWLAASACCNRCCFCSALVGIKAAAGFKATEKSGGPLGAVRALGNSIAASVTRTGSAGLPTAGAPPTPPLAAAAEAPRDIIVPPPMARKVVVGADGRPRLLPPRPLTKAEMIQAELRREEAAASAARRRSGRGCWAWVNARTLEGALDPLFLAVTLAISGAAIAAGAYSVVRSAAFDGFTVNSWKTFTQARGSGGQVGWVRDQGQGVCVCVWQLQMPAMGFRAGISKKPYGLTTITMGC